MRKRLLPLLLAVALCLGLAVPAFAAEATYKSAKFIILEDSGNICGFSICFDGDLDAVTAADLEGTKILLGEEEVEFEISEVAKADAEAAEDEEVTETLFNVTITELEEAGEYVLNLVYKTEAYDEAATAVIGTEKPVAPVADAPSSWAAGKVMEAIELGFVPEALQEKYQQATTRAEFCALAVALYEAYTETEIEDRVSFDDTDDVDVEKAAAIKVVNGVGENKFDPDRTLTRDEAAAMLSRLADALEKPIDAAEPTFADNDSFQNWAVEYIGQMQSTGIMGGVGNNTFAPKDDYTREQSIITIMRLYDLINTPAEDVTEDAED